MNFFSVLLALAVLCLCGFLGGGALILLRLTCDLIVKRQRREASPPKPRRQDRARDLGSVDALLAGELILTGLAVTAHVAAVFTGQSFSRCTFLFSVMLGASLVLAAFLFLLYGLSCGKLRQKGKRAGAKTVADEGRKGDPAERLLAGIFWALVLSQLVFLLWNAGTYAAGDMTVETVASFLHTDGIYRVDPMTGQAYTAGIPSRLKILCLPALYGFFCRMSGLDPESVVTAAVPVWVFAGSYAAFFCVGKSLFPESRKKRICFLITIVILMWAGCGFHSMDGFSLLYCGYRGVTIRNLVLIPYLISLCLRKRWNLAVLCILAEACIVWTFYGLGACLLTAAGIFLTERRRCNEGAL